MNKMLTSPDKQSYNYGKSNTQRTPIKSKRSPLGLPYDSEKRHSYLCSLTKEDQSSELQLKLTIQSNILKEYESWVYKLLTIINEKAKSNNNHVNTGSDIQNGLERLERFESENYTLKLKIVNEQEKNQMLINKRAERQSELSNIKADYQNESIAKIKNEVKQLTGNLQILADELDNISEYNNRIVKWKEENNVRQYYTALLELDQLKKERADIMKMKSLKKSIQYSNVIQSNELSKVTNLKTTIDSEAEKKPQKLMDLFSLKKNDMFPFNLDYDSNQ